MPAAGDVEEIDARVASDDVLARFYALELACHDELSPGEPTRNRDEAIAFYRYQPTTHTSCHWLADGGGASLYVHGPRAPSSTFSSRLAFVGVESGGSFSIRWYGARARAGRACALGKLRIGCRGRLRRPLRRRGRNAGRALGARLAGGGTAGAARANWFSAPHLARVRP